MSYLGVPFKVWTTLGAWVIVACADVVSWRKAWNTAKAAGEPLPSFDWVMALCKWVAALVGGNLGGVIAEPPETI